MMSFVEFLTLLTVLIGACLLIGGLYWRGQRPALAHFLVLYIPLQNLILPALLVIVDLQVKVVQALLTLKDALVCGGITLSIRNLRLSAVRLSDASGLVFLLFLVLNALWSPSDWVSRVFGIRAFAVPVLLYFYGRLTVVTFAELKSLLVFLLRVAWVVALFGLVEYVWVLQGGASPWSRTEFFSLFGHGAPTSSHVSPGFLGFTKLVGPFGNNLITAAFLRGAFCAALFYASLRGLKVELAHWLWIGPVVACSLLTLSRFGIWAVLLTAILVALQRDLLRGSARLVCSGVVVVGLLMSGPILKRVWTTTVAINDESTHTHIESLVWIRDAEYSLVGRGLGSGAHSEHARTVGKTTEGEGFIRQGLPEIGVIGLILFLAFCSATILGLMQNAQGSSFQLTRLPAGFWIALPLIFEVLHTPLDIGIRSFLGSGVSWYLAGLVIYGSGGGTVGEKT